MTPKEATALARRAVACPGWRWMPGMRYQLLSTHPWCRYEGNDSYDDNGDQFVEAPPTRRSPFAVPDLTDPATLGCLLALVREAWDDDTLSIAWAAGGWYVVQRVLRAIEALRWIDTATEAEALVAALEAAP